MKSVVTNISNFQRIKSAVSKANEVRSQQVEVGSQQFRCETRWQRFSV